MSNPKLSTVAAAACCLLSTVRGSPQLQQQGHPFDNPWGHACAPRPVATAVNTLVAEEKRAAEWGGKSMENSCYMKNGVERGA